MHLTIIKWLNLWLRFISIYDSSDLKLAFVNLNTSIGSNSLITACEYSIFGKFPKVSWSIRKLFWMCLNAKKLLYKHVWIFNDHGNNRCEIETLICVASLKNRAPRKSYRVKENKIFLGKSHKKSARLACETFQKTRMAQYF